MHETNSDYRYKIMSHLHTHYICREREREGTVLVIPLAMTGEMIFLTGLTQSEIKK
jgi:hypothetical protein